MEITLFVLGAILLALLIMAALKVLIGIIETLVSALLKIAIGGTIVVIAVTLFKVFA